MSRLPPAAKLGFVVSKRERRRARRRAERHMEEALAAAAEGHLELAERASRRAIDEGAVNPRLWFQRGKVLLLCGRDDDAEEALRQAIARAPSYAEAFATLADVQWRHGKRAAAVRLLARAVELADDGERQAKLAAWREEAGIPAEPPAPKAAPPPVWTERTARYAWQDVAAELDRRGCVRVPGLLSAAECQRLRALEPAAGDYPIVRDDDAARMRAVPLPEPWPEPIVELAAELYARAAAIANGWQARLGRTARFAVARAAAEVRLAPTPAERPAVAFYPQGGFEAAHTLMLPRDALPLCLRVDLGPDGRDGDGAFRLIDVRPGRKVRSTAVVTREGDGVLFCARERLVEVGGALGLQPVAVAIDDVTAEERCALWLPLDLR